jgi:hypothetical protein
MFQSLDGRKRTLFEVHPNNMLIHSTNINANSKHSWRDNSQVNFHHIPK